MSKLVFSRQKAGQIGWRAVKNMLRSLAKFDWHGIIYHARQAKVCTRIFFGGRLA